MPQSAAHGMEYHRFRGLWKAGRHMTEIELSRNIAEIIVNDESELRQRMKDRRCVRRIVKVRKNDNLLKIINYGGYAPHRGYIDWGFHGRTLLHSGKYIKYPKNSNCQKWIKRETSRRIRNCREVPVKSNYYRRLFDYWWTLY